MLIQLAVWITAGIFGVFGVLFLVDPLRWLQVVELRAESGTAQAEVRAMYGGLELGIAAFLCWCALSPARLMLGLDASAMLMLGLGGGRLVGLLLAKRPRRLLWFFLAVELGGGAACGLLAL